MTGPKSLMLLMRLMLPMLLMPMFAPAHAYPVDGYAYTGIRRLEHTRLVHDGAIPGRGYHPGQYLPLAQILPRWNASDGRTLPPLDAELSRQITALLAPSTRADYAVALVDLSDPKAPRYAAHNPQLLANVGSVGKVLVALAVFQTLADLYPFDLAARERVLRETQITADAFSQYDSHSVPFWDLATKSKRSRRIRVGDRASLWEYMDWMMSASSNSAAAMVQKELIALSHFGRRYPVAPEEQEAFFSASSRKGLGAIMSQAMSGALIRNGFDPELMRQGSFFTRHGNQRVDGTSSHATSEQLVRLLLRVEAGTLVDAFSSREIKRLLYMTQRRIRYASHPALNDSAVYFKSGSFFQCHAGGCAKYKGDRTNRLASIAIIESPAGAPVHHYLVAVMSNVLRVNSAVAHQTLALRIHRLIEKRHPVAAAAPPIAEQNYPVVPVDDPDDSAAPPGNVRAP